MPAPIALGPAAITISRDDHCLVSERDGRIVPGAEQGYFASDTRLLSAWELRLNGARPALLASTSLGPDAAAYELVNERVADDEGPVEAQQLSIRVERRVDRGVHEDLDLVSFARRSVRLALELRVGFDFADLFDVRSGRPNDRGRRTIRWDDGPGRLRAGYANGPFRHGVEMTVERSASVPSYRDGHLGFTIEIAPRGAWHACLVWRPVGGGRRRRASGPGHGRPDGPARGATRSAARLVTPEAALVRAWDRALADLDALRLRSGPATRGPVVPAAGIPWFLTLFGRDSLIASIQSLPVYPEFIRGSLRRLAALQASEVDPVRDMEPGKIPHELRHDELTELGLLPFSPSYATADATSLFVLALAEAHRWTGDERLVERLLPAAERAIDWIDRFGDRDGDGLQEYGRRTPEGYRNQGWKDSEDGVLHADGTLPDLPIALVELQGYAYAAKVGLADLFDLVGRARDARRLRDEAAALSDRVNERLWWEGEGTYYLGLDGAKRPIASVASNAGHLLWSGIVPPERASRVAARLLAPDMWSGWGIRTLSADHPAFDPYSYHDGSVWPHDNGIIAAGFRRYGLAGDAAQVARGILDAAAWFAEDRLPELFSGLPREATGFPVPYRSANVPQAWAAGSVIQLTATLAGLDVEVDEVGAGGASRRRLRAPGPLPDWLPALSFHDLQLRRRRVSLAVGPAERSART